MEETNKLNKDYENEKYVVGRSYEGFKLLRKEFVKEIDSFVLELEDEKTNAKVVKVLNDDINRAFGIGFSTPVNNSKGIPHIIEHSVLVSSEKYNEKDIFFEVAASSIVTFLNASTYPDRTLYPFSTTNEKEYFKIMDVYLNSVFKPMLLTEKNIFRQEGWRYEIVQKGDKKKLDIVGVVFNEMLGARSSPFGAIEIPILKSLYEGTHYQNDFGGNPLEIPNLTYEEFVKFYKENYHPSNSLIYFYGRTDLIKELNFVKTYLNEFEKNDNNYKNYKKPVVNEGYREIIEEYAVTSEEELDNYYFAYNFDLTEITNYEEYIKLKLLGEILFETNSSPLKRAILDSNFCEDFTWYIERDILFSNLSLIFHNSKKKYKEKIKKLIDDELKKLVKEGIDRELIESVINRFEIGVREDRSSKTRVPKGVKYFTDIATLFFYGGDIIKTLKYEDTLKYIKENYKNNLFENLINKYLLNSKKRGFVVLKPTLDSLQSKIEKRLDEKFRELTDEERKKIIKEQEEFNKFQNRKSKGNLELLDLNEINVEPINYVELKKGTFNLKEFDNEESTVDNKILSLQYSADTKKINYLSLYFDITNVVDLNEIQYLELLKEMLDEVKTKKYSYADFSNFINKNTGGIDFSIEVVEDLKKKPCKTIIDLKDCNNMKIYFKITVKFLEEKREKVLEILNEYFNNIILDEDKIEEIIKRIKSNLEIDILESGDYYALLKNRAQYTLKGKILEFINGVSFILFIKGLDKQLGREENPEVITNNNSLSILKKKLTLLYLNIFRKENLKVITLLKDRETSFDIEEIIKSINLKNETKVGNDFNKDVKEVSNIFNNLELDKSKNYAIATSSSILYNSKGFNFRSLVSENIKYSGIIKLLGVLLKSQYLLTEIRFNGGAYGVRAKADKDGDFFFFSYRDPNLERTYKKYDEALNYVVSFDVKSEEDIKKLKKAIIATVSNLDYPDDISTKFEKSVYNYLLNIDFDDLKREKEEIVKIGIEELKSVGGKLLSIFKESKYCSVGNKTIIEKNKELFDEVIYL